jgi:RHS repeat-associated protein
MRKYFISFIIFVQVFSLTTLDIAPMETLAEELHDSTEKGIQSMSEIFQINENVLKTSLEEGHSLADIQNALLLQNVTDESYEELIQKTKPKLLNYSSATESQVTNELPEDYVLGSFSTTKFNLTRPILDPSKLLTSITSKTNEAPYSVALNQESVSTLSGGLTFDQVDASLPGRNGVAFALKRSYNSQNAQMNSMKIGVTYGSLYYVKARLTTTEVRRVYFAENIVRLHDDMDYGCDGSVDFSSPSSTVTESRTSPYYPTSEGASSHGFIEYGEWSTCEVIDDGPLPYGGNTSLLSRIEGKQPDLSEQTYSYHTSLRTRIAYYPDYVNDVYYDYQPVDSSVSDVYFGPYTSLEAANQKSQELSSGGSFSEDYLGVDENGYEIFELYDLNSPTVDGPYNDPSSFYSDIEPSIQEKRFPIGLGWSWNIPFVEEKTVSGAVKRFVHLGDGSAYEVEGTALKEYMWKDYTFKEDSSAILGGIPSKYVLSSVKGINHYFDAGGNLLYYSDSYGNKISFSYTDDTLYGKVLSTIKDDIGNTISITYSKEEVRVTQGSQTTIYKKRIEEGKELLSQVINPLNQKTTFDYTIKQAMFNLVGTTPNTNNPYFLMTGVTHPTGAKTVYTYSDTPITRYMSSDSVNQVYKVKSRHEEITTSIGPKTYNLKQFTYQGDLGSSYGSNDTFSTSISNNLTTITYFNKKVVDSLLSPVFYNTQVQEVGKYVTKYTDYTYDEVNKITIPIGTTTYNIQKVNNVPTSSKSVTSTRKYNSYGDMIEETADILSSKWNYGLSTSTLTVDGKVQTYQEILPIQFTQTKQKSLNGQNQVIDTVYEYVKNVNGQVLKNTVTTSTNGQIISKNEGSFDTYGNIKEYVEYQSYESPTVNSKATYYIDYSPSSQYAFPSEYRIEVADVDGIKSTIRTNLQYNISSGKLVYIKDGKNYETHIQYDPLERVTKVIYRDPAKTLETSPAIQYSYDDVNNEVKTVNEIGTETKQTWNPLGWKMGDFILENGIYKSRSQQEYDTFGRVIKKTDARGNNTTINYDEFNRTVEIIEPTYVAASGLGGKTTILYDDIQHVTSTTDNQKNTVEEKFDEYGKLLSKTHKWITSTGSNRSRLIEKWIYTGDDYQIEDGKGYLTSYTIDALGRLASVYQPSSSTITVSNMTSYGYDLTGNLIQVNNGNGKVTTKQYDSLGRVIKETDALQKVEKFYYDSNSNLTKYIDKKQNDIRSYYNYRDQLVQKDVYKAQATGSPILDLNERLLYTWDDSGRKTSQTDNTGKTEYAYFDPADSEPAKYSGALKSTILPDQSKIEYKYNQNGNRTSMKVQIGTSIPWTIDYSYDVANRINNVNEASLAISESYSYTNNGLIDKITKNNHSQRQFTYDGNQLSSLTDKKLSDNSSYSSYGISYDANSNITKIVDGSLEKQFTYDSLDRILSSSINNEQYGYDRAGNRIEMVSQAAISTSTVDYQYDFYNRLNQVKTNNKTVDYRYNGDGLLYERTENGVKTRFYYDGDQMIAEATIENGLPKLKARYIRGNNDTLIARVTENASEKQAYGGVAYYHHNNHGDVVSLTDSNGRTLNKYQYDVWGNPISTGTTDLAENPFRYSGEYWDTTTNLQYLRARWYDPSMGRFISEDTYEGELKNPLSLNLYTYVENNPLSYIDPSGNSKKLYQPVKDAGVTTGIGGGMPPINIANAINRTIEQIFKIFEGPNGTGKSQLALPPSKVGDFTNISNMRDFLSRIPDNATRKPWSTGKGAQQGIKYEWVDGNGNKWNLRAHEMDPLAPSGSHASKGWIYRVEVRWGGKGKTYYMDSKGEFYPENVMNEKSPMYNEIIANDTHIPLLTGGADVRR